MIAPLSAIGRLSNSLNSNPFMSLTEADTCRKYVLPKLYAAGWNDDQITEQKTFTDGRIVVGGGKPRRKKQKCSEVFGARSECTRHSGTYSRTPHVGAWRDP